MDAKENNQTADLEFLAKEQQNEINKLRESLENYKKWYNEELSKVNEQKTFIKHIKGLIDIYLSK